ncbi:RNA polymerase sigma-70 factor [Spirosoma endbachense]|uniref:RNA polymerase sigma-70 factor n=1 Tax=Spirosoma endbachense TaxID=2666025 RepID=A0A6P1VVP3_9BACT|nr:RNA polymerase sigma-70 factor [Spirosoma endbachense]QHV95920.1 RNA polymerase sigma-70 factor [Spirosoma endbachense]
MTESEGQPLSNQGNFPRPFQTPDRVTSIVDNEHIVRSAFTNSPQKGFEALFRLYYLPLCSHAVRFVYTREVAEDIVGEVFYQLWKTGSYATIQHTYRTYLYAAVRHRAYNYLRDELTGNRTPASLDDIGETSLGETPQTLIEYDETFQRVEKVIHELPPQCQRIFLMSRFENRKNQEIADELGLALKTVEAHMARALQQLRRVFLPIGLFLFLPFH